VDRRLSPPVERETGLRDLDNQHRFRGGRAAIVAWRSVDDRNVRFGPRSKAQSQRRVGANEPARSERCSQRCDDEVDGGSVRITLGFLHHEQAIEKFQPLVFAEEAPVDQALVLGARPPPRAYSRRAHRQRTG